MHVSALFETSDQLGSIFAKVKLLNSLQKMLANYVDTEFSANFQVANYHQGCLVIQFTNAALATRFRYQIPHLLHQLRVDRQLSGLASIKCVIRPERMESPSPVNKNQLSKKSSVLLQQTANYINNPDLAAALRKLGSCDEQ